MIDLNTIKPMLKNGIPRLSTQYIIVHCSATKPTQLIGAKEINSWHKQNGWAGIGYHYVIKRNSEIDGGRSRGIIGAHAKGYNSKSISVCLVGGIAPDGVAVDNFTIGQMATLRELLLELKKLYPKAKIIGHRDVEKGKLCPCFDVTSWCQRMGVIKI